VADEDTEIRLGASKLLGLFFMLAAVCGIFFAVGFSLGKTAAREQALQDRAAADARAVASVPELSTPKPSVAATTNSEPAAQNALETEKKPDPDLTFYKAVRQPGADSNLDTAKEPVAARPVEAPAAKSPGVTPAVKTAASIPATTASVTRPTLPPARESPSAPATAASGAFLVQIAAVTREEDAAALAGALRKKSYAASVINNPVKDKFFHVVIGPYATLQDAEAMKLRLQGEGYNPIVKR
jgi:cell division septation protein DedD